MSYFYTGIANGNNKVYLPVVVKANGSRFVLPMETIKYIPHPALQRYVQAYILTRLKRSVAQKPFSIDIFPMGCTVLSYTFNGSHSFREQVTQKEYRLQLSFTGHLDAYRSLLLGAGVTEFISLGIVFTPSGAYRLLGLPQRHFINTSTEINDFLPDAYDLYSRLEDCRENQHDIIATMEKWLLHWLDKQRGKDADRIAGVCKQIELQAGNMPIHTLCRQVGMSKTSLEDHFKEQVGLSPKMYSRIIRFNRVHQFIRRHATTDWQELVYRFQYFDQAHFIREFKQFFGYTPSQIHLSSYNLASEFTTKL